MNALRTTYNTVTGNNKVAQEPTTYKALADIEIGEKPKDYLGKVADALGSGLIEADAKRSDEMLKAMAAAIKKVFEDMKKPVESAGNGANGQQPAANEVTKGGARKKALKKGGMDPYVTLPVMNTSALGGTPAPEVQALAPVGASYAPAAFSAGFPLYASLDAKFPDDYQTALSGGLKMSGGKGKKVKAHKGKK